MWIKALNSASYSLNTSRIQKLIIYLWCRLWILTKFLFIKTYSDASQSIKTKIEIFRLFIQRIIDMIIRFSVICSFYMNNSWTTQLNNIRETSFNLSADNLNTCFSDSDKLNLKLLSIIVNLRWIWTWFNLNSSLFSDCDLWK